MNLDQARRVVAEWLEEWQPPDFSRLGEILAVVGPRRAGKTCLLFQWIERLVKADARLRQSILFVDFEDYRLAGMTPGDVDLLLVAFQELAGHPPEFLFFDEIQHLPLWSRVLRTLHNQRRFRIVVSGSSSQLLAREVSSELRGRYRDQVVFPLSFREALRFKGIQWTPRTFHLPARGQLTRAFGEFLREGGYPEILLKPSLAEKRKLAQNYYQTIFYRDILERYNIKAKAVVEAMMRYCVDNYASLLSISAFEKQLKAHGLPGSKRTISNYLRFFEETYFLVEHEKFSWSARKRLLNPKKVYLLDSVFASLAGSFSDNRDRLLENVVAVELRRRGVEAFYYRNGAECDFILGTGNRPEAAMQVCWELDPRTEPRELAGLSAALREFNIPKGMILTGEQEMTRQVDGRTIPVIPAWKWLLQDTIP